MNQQRAVLTLVVAIAVVLGLVLVVFGGQVTGWTQNLLAGWGRENRLATAGSCIALLVADVLLPVPSSLICTAAGAALGPGLGAAVMWLGLNLAAIVAWGTGRLGLAAASRGLQPVPNAKNSRKLVWLVALARPVPLLAESTLIAAGSMRLKMAELWWPVAIANAAIAVIWTVLGAWAQNEWLGVAAVIAVIAPVAIAALVVPRWTGGGGAEPGGKQETGNRV